MAILTDKKVQEEIKRSALGGSPAILGETETLFAIDDKGPLFTAPFIDIDGKSPLLGIKAKPLCFALFASEPLTNLDEEPTFTQEKLLSMAKSLQSGKKNIFLFDLTLKQGKKYLVLQCGLVYLRASHCFIASIHRLRDVEDLTNSLLAEREIDLTTGIYNKDACLQDISSLPLDGKSYVIFTDLNNFKLVNDLYGHIVGDKILKRFAEVLSKNKSSRFKPYRFGGDEFVAIARNCKKEDVVAYLNAINTEFYLAVPEKIGISFSAGVACSYSSIPLSLLLLSFSDRAMYEAKKNKKPYYFLSEKEELDLVAFASDPNPF
jgi:diguanylate cyclase (GGDEF)-like protein